MAFLKRKKPCYRINKVIQQKSICIEFSLITFLTHINNHPWKTIELLHSSNLIQKFMIENYIKINIILVIYNILHLCYKNMKLYF